MKSSRTIFLGIVISIITGCLFSNDQKHFNCAVIGLVRADSSNWIKYVDSIIPGPGSSYNSFRFGSKYPFQFKTEIYNNSMKLLRNNQPSSIDSLTFNSFAKSPDSLLYLNISVIPLDASGNLVPSGCYKLRLIINALYQNYLISGDQPNSINDKIVGEYNFQYINPN